MLPDGTGIIFAGGINSASEVQRRSVEHYDVRTGIAEAVVHQDAILVARGNDIKLGELYDVNADSWSFRGVLNTPRGYHSANVIYDLPNRWVTAVPTAMLSTA